MQGYKRDDGKIMRAVEASNRGDHRRAASLYQDAGNQIRNPDDKRELWKAAERSRRIADSD